MFVNCRRLWSLENVDGKWMCEAYGNSCLTGTGGDNILSFWHCVSKVERSQVATIIRWNTIDRYGNGIHGNSNSESKLLLSAKMIWWIWRNAFGISVEFDVKKINIFICICLRRVIKRQYICFVVIFVFYVQSVEGEPHEKAVELLKAAQGKRPGAF